jgi:hypothetical protein
MPFAVRSGPQSEIGNYLHVYLMMHVSGLLADQLGYVRERSAASAGASTTETITTDPDRLAR